MASPRTTLQSHHESEGCDCAFHSGTEHAEYFSGHPSLALEAALDSDSETDSSERPVQGPMPYEPEDAPWKRNETSGIRKFFRRVFGATVPAEEAETYDQDSSSDKINVKNVVGFKC